MMHATLSQVAAESCLDRLLDQAAGRAGIERVLERVLVSLLHAADRHGVSFDAALDAAEQEFLEEVDPQ